MERHSLARNAVYTQRELIDTQLETLSAPLSEGSTERRAILLNSYCDLIERRTIYVSAVPQACTDMTTEKLTGNEADWSKDTGNQIASKTRQCTSQFHRCLKHCQLRSSNCRRFG